MRRGLVGYVGGVLADMGAFDRADGTVRMPALLAYGFASGLLYGVVINAYDIIGFVQPLTWAGAGARLATAADARHMSRPVSKPCRLTGLNRRPPTTRNSSKLKPQVDGSSIFKKCRYGRPMPI